MTLSYKPFRLINQRELQDIQQRLTQSLQIWNTQYALFPLTLTLSTALQKPIDNQNYYTAHHEKQALALWFDSPKTLLKTSLFGDMADCFDAISQSLFMLLLEQLLDTKNLNSQCADCFDESLQKDWFYKGAPTMTMTLTTNNQTITLYLHPQYVLSMLKTSPIPQKPKSTLDDALSKERLHCQIECHPLSLRLQELQSLKIGDVIKLNHPLDKPLHLVHQQTTFADVELGASQSLKSIQIMSLL